jgi:hypothetical protein
MKTNINKLKEKLNELKFPREIILNNHKVFADKKKYNRRKEKRYVDDEVGC